MTVLPIEIIITGLDPVIHLLRKKLLRRLMDARIKSGHDGSTFSNSQNNFKHDFTPRGAMRPSRCIYFSPKEGVGNAGCPLHPQPRVHFVLVERTRVTTSTPERPAFPHAMVLTVYFVLSPVTGLFCHRRLRNMRLVRAR